MTPIAVWTRRVVVAALLLTAACSDAQDEPEAREAPATSPVVSSNPESKDSLTDIELGGLAMEKIVLTLPWKIGTIDRAPVDGSRTGVTAVNLLAEQGFDRFVVELAEDGPFPGYHLEGMETPLAACGRGDPLGPYEDGWLVVRLLGVQASGSDLAESELPGFTNLAEVQRTCERGSTLEWSLGLRTSATYRIMEMRSPRRLVVDIRH